MSTIPYGRSWRGDDTTSLGAPDASEMPEPAGSVPPNPQDPMSPDSPGPMFPDSPASMNSEPSPPMSPGSLPPTSPDPWAQRASSPRLSPVIESLRPQDLDPWYDGNKPAKITNCQYFASYNLLDEESQEIPMILIPGAPAAWSHPMTPVTLDQDPRDFYPDYYHRPNAARHRIHPAELAVSAIFLTTPTFSINEIDIFAREDALLNLLRFVRQRNVKPFRIRVEMVGHTAFLIGLNCTSNEPTSHVRRSRNSIQEAFRTWDPEAKGSQQSYRILRYKFAGLNCCVEVMIDGCVRETDPTAFYLPPINDQSRSHQDEIWRPRLHFKIGGKMVPQSSIFELKVKSTTSAKRSETAHFWITQTAQVLWVSHEEGDFDYAELRDVRRRVLVWENNEQHALRQFATLIRKIVSIAQSRDDGKCEVRLEEIGGVLEIQEQMEDAQAVLPSGLKTLWADGGPSYWHDIY